MKYKNANNINDNKMNDKKCIILRKTYIYVLAWMQNCQLVVLVVNYVISN